ncbi:N-carbamoylputrescine amidase [Hwanghaeella sp.]|uniref:N-carbamoylputrescine amidase n=1 Tax=Hwanghaeella sp. TaxID=2605943 RepID=UPI003CCBCF96
MKVTVAATQMACSDVVEENVARGEALVRDAANQGANIVLLQELFEGLYFCQDEAEEHYQRARPFDGHPTIEHFQRVAAELNVVLPISFYERAGNTRFNSVAIINADGTMLGLYRKSHIPHGAGYQEKFYFTPGDTGFRVWRTQFGTIGVGICWDQWFPEAARCMALKGADVLFYPTAIGSELGNPNHDSSGHWRRVMQGHAGANITPIVASNRIGREPGLNGTELTFYGTSFITGATGEILTDADRSTEQCLLAEIDLNEVRNMRAYWGLFRDRRPDLYDPILTHDGTRIA